MAELSKLTYVEVQIIISPFFLCISVSFLQKAVVQYINLRTALLYFFESLSVFMNISKKPRHHFSHFRHFQPILSEINLKDDITSILFTVTSNISTTYTGNNS